MRAQLLQQWIRRAGRPVVLFGALAAAASTPACVCTPTEYQLCDDDREEELYPASGRATINGAGAPGIWIVASTGDSLRTDIAGGFHFELPLSGITLTARAPAGIAFLRSSVSIGLTGRDSIHFEGYRVAGIRGHVRYRGQPVPAVVGVSGPVTRADTTAADGSYAFAALPPAVTIGYDLDIVDGPRGITDAAPTRRVILAGRDTVVDIEALFLDGGRIRGRVAAGANGIAGVTVTVTGLFTFTDTTDTDGRYVLPDLPLGEYTVTIGGFDSAVYAFGQTSRAVTLAQREHVLDFTATEIVPNQPPVPVIAQPADGAIFTQGTPITFTGSASDPEDGALGGASLVWTEGSGVPLGTGSSITTSTLSALQHRIWLTATDSQGRSAATSILITVTQSSQPGTISGRVTANGYGICGVLVTLSGAASATTVTDGNANYSFQNVQPGTYTVSISNYPSGVSFPSTSQTVTLAGGQNLVVNFAGTY